MTDKPEYLSNIEPFVNESEVYLIFKDGRRFLVLIWYYSNELELLQNAGWKIFPTGIVTWKEFLIMSADNKLLSNPYWTCNCKKDFLYASMNTTKCSLCGAQYPHQKNGFHGIMAYFGWNNVHVFTPWDDEYEYDDEEEEEEEYEESEEINDNKRPDYLRLVQLDQYGPENVK